jgi:hypothetical protein
MQDTQFFVDGNTAFASGSVFPVFNSRDESPASATPMEIDEGDETALMRDLSIDNAKPGKNGVESLKKSPLLEPKDSRNGLLVGKSANSGTSSALQRLTRNVLKTIAQVDDETLRRIALFPYVLSGYIQLVFNLSLPAFFLYWVYSFGCSIQSDVEKKVLLFSEEVMEQIAKCSRDYRENRCDPATRVPALISACQAWEECMARDPHLVAKRSGISAEIFGETLNSFFNVLSWKTIISLILLVVGVSVIFNLTFSMSRGKAGHADAILEARSGKSAAISNGSNGNSSRRRRL